jgi:hypothetical protein
MKNAFNMSEQTKVKVDSIGVRLQNKNYMQISLFIQWFAWDHRMTFTLR